MKSMNTYESIPTSNDEDTVSSPIIQPPSSRSLLSGLKRTTQRIKPLVIPYMAPLFLVYVSEYTINQVPEDCKSSNELGRCSNSSISFRRNAFQVYSGRLSNLPNSLPTRCIHLTFLLDIHSNSQHLSSINPPILHPLLLNHAITFRYNTFNIPIIHHHLLRGNSWRISLCQRISWSSRTWKNWWR